MGDFERLAAQLESPNEKTRARAAYKLGLSGHREAVSWLKKVLTDSSPTVRCRTVNALSKFDDLRVVDWLTPSEVFRNALFDEDYDVFWVATAIQRTMRDPDAVAGLVASLEHEDWLRQMRAAKTLWFAGDKRAVKALKRVVKDKERNEHTRREAMLSLGKIGKLEAVEPLSDILNKEYDSRMMWAALFGLSHTGDPGIVGLLLNLANRQPDDNRLHIAIRNLGSSGDQSTCKERKRVLREHDHYDIRVQQTARECIEKLISGR